LHAINAQRLQTVGPVLLMVSVCKRHSSQSDIQNFDGVGVEGGPEKFIFLMILSAWPDDKEKDIFIFMIKNIKSLLKIYQYIVKRYATKKRYYISYLFEMYRVYRK
jgi:hypothetical protein